MRELIESVIAKAGRGRESQRDRARPRPRRPFGALGKRSAGRRRACPAGRASTWSMTRSTACVGANGPGDGGLIIAGTGSAGIARVAGTATIIGGRGFLLGDDGSAARIGATPLRAALARPRRSRADERTCRARCWRHFGDDPLRMMSWAADAKPGDYGAFAPQVFEAARKSGDARRARSSGAPPGRSSRSCERARSARRRAHRARRRPRRAVAPLSCPPRSRKAAGKIRDTTRSTALSCSRRHARRTRRARHDHDGRGRAAARSSIWRSSTRCGARSRAGASPRRSCCRPSARCASCWTCRARRCARRSPNLIAEGVLFHRHGAGTFIHRATPRVDQPSSRLTSFTEDMRLRGLEARSRELERGVFLPTPEEAMMLGVGPNERVFRLGRLRFADDVPMAIERAAVPLRYLPELGRRSARRFTRRCRARTSGRHAACSGCARPLLSDADAELLGVAPQQSGPAHPAHRLSGRRRLRRIHEVLVSRRHLRLRLRTHAVAADAKGASMTLHPDAHGDRRGGRRGRAPAWPTTRGACEARAQACARLIRRC